MRLKSVWFFYTMKNKSNKRDKILISKMLKFQKWWNMYKKVVEVDEKSSLLFVGFEDVTAEKYEIITKSIEIWVS